MPRLRRVWYKPAEGQDPGRQVTLGQAVAASAAVPMIFEPLNLRDIYPYEGDPFEVQLVDGGVYDNQGIANVLAEDCNVLLVSDASGQLLMQNQFHPGPKGLPGYALRSTDILKERIRQATYAELQTRVRSGLLRGLMFIHLKMGLEADPVDWRGCQERTVPKLRTPLTPFGIRRDIQQRLAEIRTDLDAFDPKEYLFLMACGYQMVRKGLQESLSHIHGLVQEREPVKWAFDEALQQLRSTGEDDDKRRELLELLKKGSQVNVSRRG